MTSGLERVPAPLRRMAGLLVAGFAAYGLLVGAGTVLLPPAVTGGSTFRFWATVGAAGTAYFLVYHGGYARIRDRLG